jgi:serine/threonine protein kinase
MYGVPFLSENRWNLVEGDVIVPGRSALRRLGGGNRYEAYLAWDEALWSIVVVKMLRPHMTRNARALEGLRLEANLLRRLNHPVVLRSYDAVTDGDRPHLVLEHLEGGRLSSLIRKYGWLPPEQLLPIALQLCSALHYLHGMNVVHLDVKPSNVIMGAPPRLIDFSIARSVARAALLSDPIGTDNYMAPEQTDPTGGDVGPPSDVWGLGATLYRAATGELPFSGSTQAERWPARFEPVRPFAREVPPVIGKQILACLEKDPANRPTPAEIADVLEPLQTVMPKPVLGRLRPRLQ